MGIPLYGQNKDGNKLLAASHIVVKKYEFVVPANGAATADNTVLGSINAGLIPLAAFYKCDVALSSDAVALDLDGETGDPPVTGALASLAADAVRGSRFVDNNTANTDEFALDGAARDIMINGSGWHAAGATAGTFTLWIYGIDAGAAAADADLVDTGSSL